MRGKAFFSKVAKCALVFSTLSNGGVSLFGYIPLVHTTGQRKCNNLLVFSSIGESISFLEIFTRERLMSFLCQCPCSYCTHVRIGGFPLLSLWFCILRIGSWYLGHDMGEFI